LGFLLPTADVLGREHRTNRLGGKSC
jgi:hypothetical protein